MTKQEERYNIVVKFIEKGYDCRMVVSMANEVMESLYGKDWNINHATPTEEKVAHQNDETPIVSIVEQDGQKGVRLCVGDVDIFIEAHDLDGGKEYNWEEAMVRLEEVGKETFNKHQMYMLAAFKDEINAKMQEIGGDELTSYYWSSTESNDLNAWLVYFSSGYIYYLSKYYTYVVRPVAAIKK